MAEVNCVVSEDQFRCSICLEVFTDPVTTTCGHSFCNVCINNHWDNCVHCHCPVCKEEFSSRPQLKTSTVVSEMVSEFRNKPHRDDSEASESEAAPAGDVLCDFCPEPKLKARKCCLVCQTSYCPDHLTPHNTVPRLKKHQLIGPVENLEERICPQHQQLLLLFCREHSHFMCLQCLCSEQRDHSTVPLKEQCEQEQTQLQQKIQERRKKIQELQSSVQLSQQNSAREMKEGIDFFNDLIKCVQESLDQFKENIKKKHQEVKEKVEGFVKDLESEISALEQRRAQMEQIFSSDDHFHFVQTFTLDKAAPQLNDWTEVSVRAPSYEGRVVIALSDLWLNEINPKIETCFEDELERAKQHSVDVTLDPDTAYIMLVVSPKQVQYNIMRQTVQDSSKRFSNGYVSAKEKFSSGRFYFEVQVKGVDHWSLGVVTESADRKAPSTKQNGYWETGDVWSSLCWSPEKVGVFVDYEEGLVCFFDAETSTVFKSFSDCCFTESLLPVFSPDYRLFGTTSAPLIITPVNVES